MKATYPSTNSSLSALKYYSEHYYEKQQINLWYYIFTAIFLILFSTLNYLAYNSDFSYQADKRTTKIYNNLGKNVKAMFYHELKGRN